MDEAKHWGILAASREPITKTVLLPPLHAPGSWLEVTNERSRLTLVGLRMPAWEGRSMSAGVSSGSGCSNSSGVWPRPRPWSWATSTPRCTTRQSHRAQTYGGDLLRSLTREHGWRDPYDATRTTKQPTFWHRSSRRIDYALVSPAFDGSIDAIDAPTEVGDLVTSGPSRTEDGEAPRKASRPTRPWSSR